MPYNSHQDLPPYYSGGIGNSSSSSSSNLSSSNSSSNSSLNSTSASPPLLHHQQQHLHHHQQHHQYQQQQAKLSSPESSLSPLSSSSSSSSSLSAYPNMTSSMTGLFAETDDVDMQPLDLSVRSGREEQVTKRPRLADHKPSCLVRSCVCNLGNTRAQRLSPYPLLAPGMARSPNPRMSSSPLSRTDSPFYTQRRTPSPAYYNGGICPSNGTSSLYHLPPPTQPTVTTTATEGSSFQILTTSDNVLNGIPNHSGLFRPYDDHIDSDLSNMNANPSGEILQDQPPVAPPQPPQHAQQQEEDEEEPTYMDLDSATPKSLYAKPHKDYSGSSSTICHEKSASEMATVQRGNSEGRTQTALTHNEPTVLPTSSSIASCDSSEMKTAMYYVGVGTSHSSSTEKVQNYQNGEASYLSNGMPTRTDLNDHQQQDQHQMQPQHHPQQMYHPDSSSPTNGMSSSPGHMTTLSVYPNNPQPIRFPYPGGHLDQSDDLSPAGDARFPVVPATEQPHHYPQQQQPQQQSPAPGQAQLCQTSRKSPSNKETTSENKNKSFNSPPIKKTANYFQLPVTSTSPNDLVGLKNRRNGERRGSISLHRPPSVSEGDNEDSTKISLLDFWISKILMERSASEIPPSYKPCNVDYIRTVDGEKKIRLRLVDLIELQVEQSLKA